MDSLSYKEKMLPENINSVKIFLYVKLT